VEEEQIDMDEFIRSLNFSKSIKRFEKKHNKASSICIFDYNQYAYSPLHTEEDSPFDHIILDGEPLKEKKKRASMVD
jgi:hypothetical protein